MQLCVSSCILYLYWKYFDKFLFLKEERSKGQACSLSKCWNHHGWKGTSPEANRSPNAEQDRWQNPLALWHINTDQQKKIKVMLHSLCWMGFFCLAYVRFVNGVWLIFPWGKDSRVSWPNNEHVCTQTYTHRHIIHTLCTLEVIWKYANISSQNNINTINTLINFLII